MAGTSKDLRISSPRRSFYISHSAGPAGQFSIPYSAGPTGQFLHNRTTARAPHQPPLHHLTNPRPRRPCRSTNHHLHLPPHHQQPQYHPSIFKKLGYETPKQPLLSQLPHRFSLKYAKILRTRREFMQSSHTEWKYMVFLRQKNPLFVIQPPHFSPQPRKVGINSPKTTSLTPTF